MNNNGTGILRISGKSLNDLEYADDLALLPHSFNMLDKIQRLEAVAASVG